MFSFILSQISDLVDATAILAQTYDKIFDVTFSPAMLSIMIAASSSSRCIIALQLSPQFFNGYMCPKPHHKWVYIPHFYNLMFDMKCSGCSSLALSYAEPDRTDVTFVMILNGMFDVSEDFSALNISSSYVDGVANLKYWAPDGRHQNIELPLFPSNDEIDAGEFDIGTFVSIDSNEFINIVRELNNFDFVMVTLTNSQVKFSYGNTQIILTREGGECIIGGVATSNQILFAITLQPAAMFCNMFSRSKRIWLFKSSNSLKGVIAAPLGLYSQYLVYFPDRK